MAAPDIPALRELNVRRLRAGELFDAAGALFRERWRTLILIVAIVHLPLAALVARVPQGAPDDYGALFIEMLAGVATSLVALIAATACALLAADRVVGETPSAGNLLGRAAGLWPGLMLTALVGGFIVFALLCCLVVPGVIFAVRYTFILQAVALRGRRLGAALSYSAALVERRWWRTAGISFLAFVPALTLAVILTIPAALFRDSLGLSLGSALLTGLAEAFSYVMLTLFFLNEEAMQVRDVGATAAERLNRPPAWGTPPAGPTVPAGSGGTDTPGPIYPP